MTPFGLKAAEKRAADAMTLEQIRVERMRVEGQILNLLQGFKKDTGLSVKAIDISWTENMTLGFGWERTIVDLRLKLGDL